MSDSGNANEKQNHHATGMISGASGTDGRRVPTGHELVLNSCDLQ